MTRIISSAASDVYKRQMIPCVAASDHKVVLKIKDAATQGIIIKATNKGVKVTKEYKLTGLTLQSV